MPGGSAAGKAARGKKLVVLDEGDGTGCYLRDCSSSSFAAYFKRFAEILKPLVGFYCILMYSLRTKSRDPVRYARKFYAKFKVLPTGNQGPNFHVHHPYTTRSQIVRE